MSRPKWTGSGSPARTADIVTAQGESQPGETADNHERPGSDCDGLGVRSNE